MKTFDWLQIAIVDASKSPGGPFGALITKDDKLVARTTNLVVPNQDPTAHAEINVIRLACRILETHNLQGCTIYCTCSPCPMCLAAILWANISELYFAATRQDAAAIGFKDSELHSLFRILPRTKWPLLTHSSWRARKDAVVMMKNWKGVSY